MWQHKVYYVCVTFTSRTHNKRYAAVQPVIEGKIKGDGSDRKTKKKT